MKLWIFSDTHRDLSKRPWSPIRIPDADVAIVAGDVGHNLTNSVNWLAEFVRPAMRVCFVAGNHEFYHSTWADEIDRGREAAAARRIDFLENDTVEIGGRLFSGCTLWTDYALNGIATRADAMKRAARWMNDHRLIARSLAPNPLLFRPEDALALHHRARTYLTTALSANRDPGTRRPHVVVTHHAPSPRSIAPAYAGNALNPAFVSDLESMMGQHGPDIWVHGHVHSCVDVACGRTRVICNPRGYDRENPAFNPALVVRLPS